MSVLPFLTLVPEARGLGPEDHPPLAWGYIRPPAAELLTSRVPGPDLTRRDCTQEGCSLRGGRGRLCPLLWGPLECHTGVSNYLLPEDRAELIQQGRWRAGPGGFIHFSTPKSFNTTKSLYPQNPCSNHFLCI